MKWSELNNLKLEDYYWRTLFGKSIHRSSFFQLRGNDFKGMPAPVFFLSTGRCGTNWFTNLLASDKSQKVFHEPIPNFGVQGKVAYEIYSAAGFKPTETEDQLLKELFLTGREQYLRYSYKTQKRFIETNNQITFLAPAIVALFPETKFVHLNRHPGEFVRSAMRRKFYNNPDDIKRIVPIVSDPFFESWDKFDLVEKNSWLWSATNQFIESFKSTIPQKNQLYFDFSTLDQASVEGLCQFLGVTIPSSVISKLLDRPVNAQRSGRVAKYQDWEAKDKEALLTICGEMAGLYNYQL